MQKAAAEYEIVIKPSKSWFGLDLAEIWRYRDLLFLLVHRDFVSNYKQTILGPLWFIIQPLITTIIFTIIFGKVAQIPTDGMPPMLFYLAGLLGWNFFSRTLGGTSSTLVSNVGLFGKVYFPRLVVPIAAVVSNYIALAIQLVTFLCFWTYYKFFSSVGPSIHIGWDILAFPLVILQISALALGVGLWLSALTAKYRDLAFLTATIIQLWMYATPIIYPVSQIPEKWRWVSSLNPMEMPVVAIRDMFIGQNISPIGDFGISITMTLFILATGVLIFNKVEKTFVDTV
jgi:lipopolysaccharide transport system permease protein